MEIIKIGNNNDGRLYGDMKTVCGHLSDILSHKTTSVQKSPVSLITVSMQTYSITGGGGGIGEGTLKENTTISIIKVP